MPSRGGSRSVNGVQFSEDLRDEVAAGAITVSVRLWRRPKVRIGGRYPVAGAVIEVTAVELLPFSSITSADVRRSGETGREALRARAAHAGPVHDDTLVYRVEFRVVEPAHATALPVFDCSGMFAVLDSRRRERGMGWYELADEMWQQSADLNAQRADDHPLCGGAVSRQGARGATSCQYALFMLRWLDRAPEEFLTGPVVDVGDVRLPEAGSDARLRWNLAELHAALNERREERGLTWAKLAQELHCTPSRLTNLRTARLADMDLAMRITQWLGRPAAAFIHPARW